MPVDTELYQLLDIPPSATDDDIKKAFRKKALIYHPDRGGDQEMFKKINAAYEILSDPQKRQLYDSYGQSGMKDSIPPPNQTDIFTSLFGNMMGGFGNIFHNQQPNPMDRKSRKTPSTVHEYRIHLEQLCKREIIRLQVTKDQLCTCYNDSNLSTCTSCNGIGFITTVRNFGPFVNHVQLPCQPCQGIGRIHKCCSNCQQGQLQITQVFELYLSPEFEDGYRYVFKGQGNHHRGHEPGDFIVILKYHNHPMYQVERKDLTLSLTITLKEALCGFEKTILHPSGEKINVSETTIVKPNTRRTLATKGITTEGHLHIQYNIAFPDSLDSEQITTLSKVL